ncbi:transcriptional regulator, GntR-family [Brachybacterium faecium]|nr:transcriptional regulator, GntR-family [Brachybacterium faecium]
MASPHQCLGGHGEGRSGEDAAGEHRRASRLQGAHRGGDADEGDPVVEVLRVRLADGVPIMLERLCYSYEVGRHVLSFDPDSGSIHERLVASGVDIHHATRLLDAVGADEVDARLLEIPEGSPLMRLRRRAFTIEGTPLEWSEDRYLPGHARFASSAVRGGGNGLAMLKGL